MSQEENVSEGDLGEAWFLFWLLKISSCFTTLVTVRDSVVLFPCFLLCRLSLGETSHVPFIKLALQKQEAL